MANLSDDLGYSQLGSTWDTGKDAGYWDPNTAAGAKNWTDWGANTTDAGWQTYADQIGKTSAEAKALVDQLNTPVTPTAQLPPGLQDTGTPQ